MSSFVLVAFWNSVFCGLVLAEEFHDAIKSLVLFEVFKAHFETDAFDVVEVFTASHDASIAEILS